MNLRRIKKLESAIEKISVRPRTVFIKAKEGYFNCIINAPCKRLSERFIKVTSLPRKAQDCSDISVKNIGVFFLGDTLFVEDIEKLEMVYPGVPWEECIIRNPDNPLSVMSNEELKLLCDKD